MRSESGNIAAAAVLFTLTVAGLEGLDRGITPNAMVLAEALVDSAVNVADKHAGVVSIVVAELVPGWILSFMRFCGKGKVVS